MFKENNPNNNYKYIMKHLYTHELSVENPGWRNKKGIITYK